MESGRGWPPDRPPLLVATVRAAVRRAWELADGLPVFAGGKSLGGRMTSTAAAEGELERVRRIVFFGFPLHTARNSGTKRAELLERVGEVLDELADVTAGWMERICPDSGHRDHSTG